MTDQSRSDADLVSAWLAGDTDAFAAIYDRYADDLYAFAMSRLRNRAEAADVVQETFVRAADRIGQLRDHTRLRAWLYAIARNRVIDSGRRSTQSMDDDDLDGLISDDPEMSAGVARAEVAELVWMAADSLNERDRELLTLHLRHGLDGADLADVVGVSPANLYVAMGRLKERMAKAVGSLLIARHGSKDCPELASVLRGWDGTFSLDVRSKVTRHVESCSECATRRAALISAASFSAGAFAIPMLAPSGLREATLQQVAMHTIPLSGAGAPGVPRRQPSDAAHNHDRRRRARNDHAGRGVASQKVMPVGARKVMGADGDRFAAEAGRWRRDGFPVPAGAAARRRGALKTIAAVVAVAGLGTAFFLAVDDDTEQVSSLPSPTEVATSVAAPSTSTPDPTTVTTDGAVTTDATVAGTTPATGADTPELVPSSVLVESAMNIHPSVAPPVAPPPPGSDLPVSTTKPTTSTTKATTPPTVMPTVAPPVSVDATVAPTIPDTTQATAPPPTLAPASIVLTTGAIDLGARQTTASAGLQNNGGISGDWSAGSSVAGVAVSPAGGTLLPGASTTLTITVDRNAFSEGPHQAQVVVNAAGGGGTIGISFSVVRPPVIGTATVSPGQIYVMSTCTPTSASVIARVSDDSGIQSVTAAWSPDGGTTTRTTLTATGPGSYSGPIGPFSRTGAASVTVQAVDVFGNATSATTSVSVLSCGVVIG